MTDPFILAEQRGLYDARAEHDGCGVAWIARPGADASHGVVDLALRVLERMSHRGAVGADAHTGDGCGITIDIDREYFALVAKEAGLSLPEEYFVGQMFLPSSAAMASINRLALAHQLKVIGWRKVPVRPHTIGKTGQSSMPLCAQLFVAASGPAVSVSELAPAMFRFRRAIEQAHADVYVCSLSARTIVYKGLLTPTQLRSFYEDLNHPAQKTRAALVHQRFSTNTQPAWHRAHPYRLLAHNGEINTVRGNPASFAMRESMLDASWQSARPLVDARGSDSAQLDNAVEALTLLGWTLDEALAMVMPPSTDQHDDLARREQLGAFALRMEAWDGPAAVLAYDGERLVARLDRNGLRPLRWWRTAEGFSIVASEVGVDGIEPQKIVACGRVQPGQSYALSLTSGRHDLHDGAWLRRRLAPIATRQLPEASEAVPVVSEKVLARYGFHRELLEQTIRVMAESGEEPIGSMGNDTPVPPFSHKIPRFFDYFRQQFAQVTNPPIDAIREERVMDMSVLVGSVGPLQRSKDDAVERLVLPHPLLSIAQLSLLRADSKLAVATLSTTFSSEGLAAALNTLTERAEQAVQRGATVVILSDADALRLPMPSALALAAVRAHLDRADLRGQVALVVDAGDVASTHDLAILVGLGAHAVCPRHGLSVAHEHRGELGSERYLIALKKGLKKVMSKMGVSVLASYRGAQLFESLGLDSEIRRYFAAMPHRLAGTSLQTVEGHIRARTLDEQPPGLGIQQWRAGGEHHAWGPDQIGLLQHAARSNRFDVYQKYARLCDEGAASTTLRGRLTFASRKPLALSEIEPVGSIVTRFKTGAMSLGSISTEAHETLAKAMNRLGGKSNTGEGGEDPERFGTERRSAIKQVASGRFGVTIDYLADADELQIKMAQGAKPGEGGQLPGHKVSALIARLRCSTEGVTLISPPPHHDIYSIEDLAQLITDLRAANPRARISVKLVSESGVGTIAAGVAKAGADVIVLSGDSGGTGASPQSSIRHAGAPFELGLAEAQQTLLANQLRGRVRLETDGLLRTGRDVVVAAMLGADEFAFATSALVAMGCVMMRVCHLNTCPVGIATQDERLRERFAGEPEQVINYMRLLAEDVRHHLAQLGVRSLGDLVGRTDLLRGEGELLRLLYRPEAAQVRPLVRQQSQPVDEAAKLALEEGCDSYSTVVDNRDRSIGARLSYERAKTPSLRRPFALHLRGIAGQSFGAFCGENLQLQLQGYANDHVGKGLSGGRVVVVPPRTEGSEMPLGSSATALVAVGNVAFFGATAGEGFIAGAAGERFAVRNSGAVLVVEGTGDHACEYMTRGAVVVLGEIGVNFAAGMSGGLAFVSTEWVGGEAELVAKVHSGFVAIRQPDDSDLRWLRARLQAHAELTGSVRALSLLRQSDDSPSWQAFRKLIPHEILARASAVQNQPSVSFNEVHR